MKKMLLVVAAATLLFSCKKETEKEKTFKGATVQFHDGKAWTTLTTNEDGTPKQLAITINDAAMNSLPMEGDGEHSHGNNAVLPLHPKALKITPYKFVGLDWAPMGHPPQNVYTLPHFDLHYYMVTETEVQGAVDMNKIMLAPPADYIPSGFVAGPPVPQMGLHWLDTNSPELNPNNPATFTQTLIVGSYDGKVTFLEPMITHEFLKNTTNFERSIPQAAKVQTTGYYPTKMRIVKGGSETSIILEAFVLREAS